MNRFRKVFLLMLGFTLIAGLSFSIRHKTDAQTKPLTYPEIITALNTRVPNKSFKTKAELINWLITQIKQRKVDKPLTEDREDDLRQAGATDQLLETIRQSSPLPAGKTTVPPPLKELAKTLAVTDKTFKNSIGMEFVRISSGTFMMGSPEEENGFSSENQHKVTISRDFYMGKYEVTQGQWKAIMGSNPSLHSECGDDCPVDYVSWKDVQLFIKKLNAKNEGTYRLPTEAEWEYAARAGKTTPISVGDGMVLSSDDANFNVAGSGNKVVSGKFLKKPVRVGSYKPNAWGLYDMHGNVAEWCADWYDPNYYEKSPSVDPKGGAPGDFRVIRGGGWNTPGNDVRSASRIMGPPEYGAEDVGFRLVRE